MPRVFIINEPLQLSPISGEYERIFNFKAARRFGDLRHLLPRGPLLITPGIMLNTLNHHLRDFTNNDYLLLVGNLLAVAAAVTVASQRTGGPVRMLVWRGELRDYDEVILPFTRKENPDD